MKAREDYTIYGAWLAIEYRFFVFTNL